MNRRRVNHLACYVYSRRFYYLYICDLLIPSKIFYRADGLGCDYSDVCSITVTRYILTMVRHKPIPKRRDDSEDFESFGLHHVCCKRTVYFVHFVHVQQNSPCYRYYESWGRVCQRRAFVIAYPSYFLCIDHSSLHLLNSCNHLLVVYRNS